MLIFKALWGATPAFRRLETGRELGYGKECPVFATDGRLRKSLVRLYLRWSVYITFPPSVKILLASHSWLLVFSAGAIHGIWTCFMKCNKTFACMSVTAKNTGILQSQSSYEGGCARVF